MRSKKHLPYLVLLPLLLQAPLLVRQGTELPTGSTVYPFVLPSTYYEYFPVDTFANTSIVEYSMTSNVTVSTAFMTSVQFQDFSNNNGEVSNSVVYQNGTNSSQTLRVRAGSYDLLVYAYERTANVTLSVTVFPNNPFVAGPLSVPEPSGIASFGLTNESGVDSPYAVASTDVLGFAAITSLGAYNSTAESVGANPSGVTLQLNSVLVVNEEGGRSQVYWCQNTPDFVTSSNQVAMADNVWNFSSSGFLSNDSITSEGGEGSVYVSSLSGTTQYYYSYEGSNSSYSLPLGMVLLVNATVEPGTGVLVEFGARMTSNEVAGNWFDNVTIHDSTVRSAYFLTSGNDTVPNGYFYDTELVFGGEGNGESTSFTQMVSSLGLFYTNGSSAAVNPFPSYFSFGQNTYESADNLEVTYLGRGEARVSVGTPNYDFLGAASGSVTTSSVEGALGFPGLSIGSSTASVSPTTTTTSTSPMTSTSTGTPSASSGGIQEFPYQFGGAVILLILIVSLYLVERRRSFGR
jgi:thermopsin